MELTGLSLIEGAPSPGGTRHFHAIEAETGAALEPRIVVASDSEIEAAASRAAASFRDYGRANGATRALFLRTIAEEVEAALPDLIVRAPRETGLPPGRIEAEAGRTVGQLRMFASLAEEGSWVDARIDHADLDRKPLPKPDIRSMMRPLGPVAVFCAGNFPLAFSVAGGDTASALAAGNPVVVVAHHAHPGTAELVGWCIIRALRACRLPLGAFSLLQGRGEDVGVPLVRHSAVQAVAFTGSRRGGLALAQVAAERRQPVPVFAEMSSVNPVVVLPGALAARGDEIARGLHASMTLGTGQFCTNPGFVFLPRGATAGSFARTLAELVRATQPTSMLTGAIRANYARSVAQWHERAALLAGTEDPPGPGGMGAGAAIFQTTAREWLRSDAPCDETFGPCTILIEYDDADELLDAVAKFEGQLTATVHGTPEELALHRDLVDALESMAGRVVFGGFPTGVEVCPAMVHGGPYPATTEARSTSVGTRAIYRFVRPVCYQNAPQELLPEELRDANPLGIRRLVDGRWEGRPS